VASHPNKCPFIIGLERNDGLFSVHRVDVAAPGSDLDVATARYLERLLKFLLWQKGGWRVVLGGPLEFSQPLRQTYSAEGDRHFDVSLMERVYGRSFEVELCPADQVSESCESTVALGGHLDGCRLGFDLGASDYKLAAVKDGHVVFTTEIPWDPKNEPDPSWHFEKIDAGLQLAAGHLPRVHAIGGSSAGIFIDNRVKVASLFRSVPGDQFADQVEPLFLKLRDKWGVPLEVVNDGDVTALAGGLSLKTNGILGVALGSSEAVGYLDPKGRITGWLNELAFAPIDARPDGPVDEWSGDIGCGALYFSQQAVGRLVQPAGLKLGSSLTLPEQLKEVQALMSCHDPRARKIYDTIGVYLGYALSQYAEMYPFRNLLILGRVTTGNGGEIILSSARKVLEIEFPELADRLDLRLPDEQSKRVGQAVAAASLPRL